MHDHRQYYTVVVVSRVYCIPELLFGIALLLLFWTPRDLYSEYKLHEDRRHTGYQAPQHDEECSAQFVSVFLDEPYHSGHNFSLLLILI